MDGQKLLETLEEMTKDEVELFKWQLQQAHNFVGDLKPLAAGTLEEANRQKIVNLIKEKYPNDAWEIVINVLKRINRNDLAQELTKIPKASGVERAQSTQATGVDEHGNTAGVGEATGAGTSTRGSTGAGPTQAKRVAKPGEHPVDNLREELINKVAENGLAAILDRLLGQRVITFADNSTVMAEPTNERRMRKLYDLLRTIKAKDTFYQALQDLQPDILEELESDM